MTKMKKTTSARVEDALDVVADKIIDLELTARSLERIEKNIKSEVAKAEHIELQLNLRELERNQVRFISELKMINNSYLQKMEKAIKGLKVLYYFSYALALIVLLLLGSYLLK